MREIYEFRIGEDMVKRFAPEIGSRGKSLTDTVRALRITPDDELFSVMRRADVRCLEKTGRPHVFSSSWVEFKYTAAELARAELLQFHVRRVFEPTAEECETEYDESKACAICGAGREQIGPTRLRYSSIPKTADIARTFVDEVVMSDRFVEALRNAGLSGTEFEEVIDAGRSRSNRKWWRPLVISDPIKVVPPTRCVDHVFDDESSTQYTCPVGHTLGFRQFSELHIDRTTWDGSDVALTEKALGWGGGLFRPKPPIIVSQRFRQTLIDAGIRGVDYWVVHL